MTKQLKWRQGDLIIKQEEKLPDNLKLKDNTKLLSGSGISNEHVLENGRVYEKIDGQLQGYFVIEKKTKVLHKTKEGKDAEHKPLTLRAGTYSFYRQKTFLPQSYELVQD